MPLLALDLERSFGYPQCSVAGVDEVGRGCIAGPVVAAVVVLPQSVDSAFAWLADIRDSKKLTAATRDRLSAHIESWGASVCIGVASVEEIDRVNILQATYLAMERAVAHVPKIPDKILIDGSGLPSGLASRAAAVVKGDSRSLAIAAASIVAKVARDRMMRELDHLHPGYGLAIHKGYPTAAHCEALSRLGFVKGLHRESFGPVRLARRNAASDCVV